MDDLFVEKYTASLAGIPANHFPTQESDREPATQDTFGRLYENTFVQLDLFGASSRMSQDTCQWDSMKFSKTLEIYSIKLRQDCLQRQRSAHPTNGSGCLSWLTPCANEIEQDLEKFKKRMEKYPNGTTMPSLSNQVNWPTPTQAEADKIGNNANFGQIALGNHPAIRGLPERPKTYKNNGQLAPDSPNTNGKNRGRLNAAWVESLMGLPKNWTQIEIEWTVSVHSETESSRKQQPKRG